MQIVIKKLSELTPYANNARTHSAEQVAALAKTIQGIRWTNPIMYDDSGIIAGHGRLLVAEHIYAHGGEIVGPGGNTLPPGTAPCIYLPGLGEVERKALILADNKHAEKAGWDDELLRIELEALKDLDFDLDLTGFDPKELDFLLSDDLGSIPEVGSRKEKKAAHQCPKCGFQYA